MPEKEETKEVKEEIKEETKKETKEETKEEPKRETTPDDLKNAVRAVLSEMGVGSDGAVSRRSDMESLAEKMVRDASEKLNKEKELHDRIATIEETVKEATEETPRKVRKITKALWGDER
jgi:hypothetical protein